MAREDVSVGGIVYYGYSLESPEDWRAGLTALRKKMNSSAVTTSSDSLEFIFRYGWMSSGNNVVKVTAADSNRGLAFTIFDTGLNNVWAWISGSGTENVNSPNWNGRTSGDIWTSGVAGISTPATSVSIARVEVIPSTGTGTRTTAAYLIQNDNNAAPLIYPNGMTSAFTPFSTTLSGTPTSTAAKISIFGPVHAPTLAGYGSPYVCMATQTTQPIPYGSYNFSASSVDGKIIDRRFQGVMMNSGGSAVLFMMADTGTSSYDDEE